MNNKFNSIRLKKYVHKKNDFKIQQIGIISIIIILIFALKNYQFVNNTNIKYCDTDDYKDDCVYCPNSAICKNGKII